MAENSILLDETNGLSGATMEKNYTSNVAKNYINQRREKAQRQTQDEKTGVAKAALAEKWDEMVSYKYAIF